MNTRDMRMTAFSKILKLKQAASHKSLLNKARLTPENFNLIFRSKLFEFVVTSAEYKDNLLGELTETLNNAICPICQFEFVGKTVILKCGHI